MMVFGIAQRFTWSANSTKKTRESIGSKNIDC